MLQTDMDTADTPGPLSPGWPDEVQNQRVTADAVLVKNRPGENARLRLKADRKIAAKRLWQPITGFAVVLIATSVGIALLPTFPALRGFLIGFLTASFLVAVAWMVLVYSGSYGWSLGKMGEEFTAEVLIGPARRRAGWRLVNGIYFDKHGDIDHVLIGPGGVFVIESKFTTSTCRLEGRRVVGITGREPIDQARHGAQKVQKMLRYGRDRFDVTVRPLVVIWGPGRVKIEKGWQSVDDVMLCDGPKSDLWLEELHGAVIDLDVIDRIESYLLDRVEGQAERTGRG